MKGLKSITYITIALTTSLFFTSCDKDGEDVQPSTNQSNLELQKASDIKVGGRGTTEYTYFSLKNNQIIEKLDSNSTKWDIALNSTTILVNGGTSGPGQGKADVVDGIFNELTSAPTSGYEENSVPKEWYIYNNPTGSHLIKPIAGKVLILKTAEGNYAKIEITSYYKGSPDLEGKKYSDVESGYYTFQYMVQPDGSSSF